MKNKILYKDYIYNWLKEKRMYVKESTYANYSNNIFNHIIPKLGNLYLDEINHKIIQNYILELFESGNLKDGKGLSCKTIKDIIIIIKSSIKQAINEDLMKHIELTFNYPKIEYTHSIYILNKNEQNKIVDYVLKNLNNRNIGLLITLFSGIRIGELCALRWNDIDFKRGILKISHTLQKIYIKDNDNISSKIVMTSPKTKNGKREIPINKTLLNILKELKSYKNYFIITGSEKCIEPRIYRKYFNKLLKKIKVKHFNFHSLRHTFATNCISLGIDYKTVSELLGHSTINITLNLYVHPRMSQKKKCINLITKELEKRIN